MTSGSQTQPLAPQTTPMPTDTGLIVSSTELTFDKLTFLPVGLDRNYPISFAAAGLWTLHTSEGRNIQLHFLDFSIESANDIVEVRDGTGSDSMLLGKDAVHPNCPLIGPLHWSRTSNVITLTLFFQLSSLETKVPPAICIQQPTRCPCGLSQTNQFTAEDSAQTLPLVLVWGFQVGGVPSDNMKLHLFLIHIQ